ncbi:DUF1120 domain-containing protein [Burkholderia seminalis]|uniref:DUF1120 domain-containing protein n=1 Tax=Burkholderia seminalis TaxID=488731 RepID=UPI0019080341|nr:DUF1120 domain-containing protein [Burkholderia seminalis]MBJ9967241.1 DUF1120 domain-containing protein [Burkholderia seminalis]
MQLMRHVMAPMVFAFTMAGAVPSQAADLSVSGQIRSDGACSIALGNGGVVDFGNLSREDLRNRYLQREMPLTISCQHPTKVGFNMTDNRAGTQPDWPYGSFGLGNSAIASYRIWSLPGETDWGAVLPIGWDPDLWGGGWVAGDLNVAIFPDGRSNSWMRPTNTSEQWQPVAFKTLTGGFRFYVDLLFEEGTAFTDEFEINGSATLELRYL